MEKFDGFQKISKEETKEWAKKEKKLPKFEYQPKTIIRMDKKEAENEAFWLKCIVESGNAESYDEAETVWQNIDPQDTSQQARQLWGAITELYNEKTAQYQDYLAQSKPELKDEDIHNCFACHQPLKPVFPDMHERGDSQYENALKISFDGSYDMFIDPPFMFVDEEDLEKLGTPNEQIKKGMLDNPLSLIICHDCAHDLCKKVPWISNLLEPSSSHSHSYDDDWTGHEGWDLPHDKDVDS